MKVALAFSDTPSYIAPNIPGPFSNTQLAILWLDWVAELGGCQQYELVLLAPEKALLPVSATAWRRVIRLHDRNQVSHWPLGPNLSIQQVMWWQLLNKIEEPIFWVESDAIPLAPNWIQTWEAEYLNGKKPFMGGLVERQIDGRPTPRHMTGVAIYPPYTAKYSPRLMEARHTAFDVWAADQILSQFHETNLIQHLWRHGPITTMEEYNSVIDPRANLFHSDKYGALIKLLRDQRTGNPLAGDIIGKAFGTLPDRDQIRSETVQIQLAPAPESAALLNPPEQGEEPIMPKAFAIEHLFQRIRDLIITEEDRKRLLEFLRDEKFFQIRTLETRGRKKKKPSLAGHAK